MQTRSIESRAYYKLGSISDNGKEIHPKVNFVRFAIPRLRYEYEDLESVSEAVKNLYDLRKEIPGVNVVYGKDLTLRHFKARFEFKEI